jgi:hypothetical protein
MAGRVIYTRERLYSEAPANITDCFLADYFIDFFRKAFVPEFATGLLENVVRELA